VVPPGQVSLSAAKALTLTADCGESNDISVRPWKCELQRFANETGLSITVVHLPPGTSKWNRIEHQMFAFISQNWRRKPLVSRQVIVQLIGGSMTNTGLSVTCDIDWSLNPCCIKVSKAEMAEINIERHALHGSWNYTIRPKW
jgi:Rhodopirellula transposase DDE domain